MVVNKALDALREMFPVGNLQPSFLLLLLPVFLLGRLALAALGGGFKGSRQGNFAADKTDE